MSELDRVFGPKIRNETLQSQSEIATNFFLSDTNEAFQGLQQSDQEQVIDSYLRAEVPGYAGRQDVGPIASFANAFYKSAFVGTKAAFQGIAGIASPEQEAAAAKTIREGEILHSSRGFAGTLGSIAGEVIPTIAALLGTTLFVAEPASTAAGGALLAAKGATLLAKGARVAQIVRNSVFSFQALKASGLREAEITQQETETGEDFSETSRHISALGQGALVFLVEKIGLEQFIGKGVPMLADKKGLAELGRLVSFQRPKEAAQAAKALLATAGVTVTTEAIEEGLEQFGANVLDLATKTAREGTTPTTGVIQAAGLGAIGGGFVAPFAGAAIGRQALIQGEFDVKAAIARPRQPKGDPFAIREGMFVSAVDPSTGQFDTARVDKLMAGGASARVTFTSGEKATVRTSDTSADYFGLSDEQLIGEAGLGANAEKNRRAQLRSSAETPGSALNTLIGQGKVAFPEHQDEINEAIPFLVSLVAQNEGLSPNEVAERIGIEQGEGGEAPVLRLYQQGTQPWYYSKLEKVVNGLQLGKRIRSTELRNVLLKRGVKAQEMRSTGLQSMMDENEFIGRENLVRHVQENLVRVESVVSSRQTQQEATSRTRSIERQVAEVLSAEPVVDIDISNFFQHSLQQLRNLGISEDLVTLAREYHRNLGLRRDSSHIRYTLPGGEDYTEVRLVTPDVTLEGQPGFEAINAHFPEDNIAGWFRSKTRYTDDGKKVLYLEELQSDWAATERRLPSSGDPSGDIPGLRNPFGDKWYEPVLKYAIRFATENGYDAVSFTSPEVQKNRWGAQADVVSRVEYKVLPDGDYSVISKDERGDIVAAEIYSRQALVEAFPGNIVDRITRGEGVISEDYTLLDVDFRIGGSGEKFDILYGQQIPSFLKKFARRHKAEVGEFKVSRDDLSSLKDVEGPTVSLNATKAPLLNLNNSIRQEALDGAELFQRAPSTGEAKGSAEVLNSGRVIIRALKSPDISTVTEELFHAYQLLFPQTFDPVARWAGAKQDADGNWDWTVNTNAPYEKLAKAWLKYLANGSAPGPRFKAIFEKMRSWFKSIWNRLSEVVGSTGGKKQKFKVNAGVQAFFDRLVAGTATATGSPIQTRAGQAASLARLSQPLRSLADDTTVVEPGKFRRTVQRGSTVLAPVTPKFTTRLEKIDVAANIAKGSDQVRIADTREGLTVEQDELATLIADDLRSEITEKEWAAQTDEDKVKIEAHAKSQKEVYDGETDKVMALEQIENLLYGRRPGDDDYKGVRKLANGTTVPINKSGHSISQMPNAEGLKVLTDSENKGKRMTPRLKAEVDRVIAKGKAEGREVDKNAALAQIRIYAKSQLGGVNPYFNRERTYQLPRHLRELRSGVIAERTILPNNIYIEGLREFGIDLRGQGLNQLDLKAEIERVKDEVGTSIGNDMEDFIDHIFGGASARDPRAAKLIQSVSNFETASKLAGLLGPFRNSLQTWVDGIARYGIGPVWNANLTLFPFISNWTKAGKAIRRANIEAGVITARTAFTEAEPQHKTLVDWAISLFIKAEVRNQHVAALIATYGIDKDIRTLMKREDSKTISPVLDFFYNDPSTRAIERRAEKVQLTDEDVIRLREKILSGERLVVGDIKKAAFLFNRDTNFPLTLTTERLWWRRSPGMRLMFKFKMFGVEQMGLIYRDVVAEARHGNPMPAMRFLLAGFLVGELYNLARDLLYDKEESLTVGVLMAQSTENRRIGTRVLNNFLDGGVIGIFADVVYGSGNFILGPAGGSFINGLDAIIEAGYTPGPARAEVLLAAAKKEVPAIRQFEGVWKMVSKGLGDENNFAAYQKARNLAAEIDETVEDDLLADIGQFTARALAPAHTRFPFTERTFLLRKASLAIASGDDADISEAASMIAQMYTAADPEDRVSVRRGILSALKRKSPLGAVKKRNMREFRGRLTPLEFTQIREADRTYLRDVQKAYRQGIRDGNRIFDQREQGR